jgi:outer membrane protein assembly factor BamB
MLRSRTVLNFPRDPDFILQGHLMRRQSVLLTGFALSLLLLCQAHAQNWPRFRGENGAGTSDLKGIPSTWNDNDYAWKIELPNVGHSCPIIWDKTLFVTSATEGGAERFVHCIDADSGKERWQMSLKLNESKKHQKNNWASSSPVTDGTRVYVLFADDTRQFAAAWDFKGNEFWRQELGSYHSEHGLGASPILQNGLLIVSNDQVGPSSRIAFNAETGKPLCSQRIDGGFSGSPICIGDRLFSVAENGDVVVIRAADHFEELGRTPLGDDCHSTPAVANGHYVSAYVPAVDGDQNSTCREGMMLKFLAGCAR